MNQHETIKLSILLNLPPLAGNQNEIQQAEQIRAKKLEQVPFFEKEWEMFCSTLEVRLLPDNCLQQLKQQDDAKFWIENCDLDFWELLELLQ